MNNTFKMQYLLFVFALVLFNPIQTKKMCDLKDHECLKKGAGNVYKSLVTGIKGLIEPIDPAHLDKIEGEIEGVKYQLTNVTLVGFGNCEVVYISLNKSESSFDERLHCPQLVVNFKYEAKGKLSTIDIDEKGLGKVTAFDYLIIVKGNYGYLVFEKDHKPHYLIKGHRLETNPKGKLVIEAKNELFKNKDNAQKAIDYMNDNWKAMDKYFRSPMMEKFVAIIVNGIDTVVRNKPSDQIFPKID